MNKPSLGSKNGGLEIIQYLYLCVVYLVYISTLELIQVESIIHYQFYMEIYNVHYINYIQ